MTALAETAVDCLTGILLPIMRDRMSRLGVDESGAYHFYEARLNTARVFSDCELMVFQALAERRLEIDEIHEIGCGWGQLVFLFAWSGYRAIGYEADRRRFAGADDLHRSLMQIDERRTNQATIRNEFFPPPRRPGPASMVIATNLVGDHLELVEEQMIWGLRRYRYALIDIDRFCHMRQPAQRPAFLARIAEAGLRDLGVLFDAGSQGLYHLFEPTGDGRAPS